MSRKKIYVIPGIYCEKFVIRFVVCSRFTIQDDIEYAWQEISSQACEILRANFRKIFISNDFNLPLKRSSEIISKIKEFEIENKKKIHP